MSTKLGEHLETLREPEAPLSRRDLAAFANLNSEQLAAFGDVWRTLPESRRVEIVKTMQSLAEDNIDLNFRAVFWHCLNDPGTSVRAVAADGLWEDESIAAMRRLLELLDDPAGEVRMAALLSLSHFAYRASLDELPPHARTSLHDHMLTVAADPEQPPDVQRRAVENLGYFADSSEAQAEVGRAYASSNLRMRESALLAMGRSMRSDWFNVIERELQSPLPALRFAAAQAVGELGDDGETLLMALLPLVDDDDTEVATMAIWALGQVGGPHAKRVLQRLIRIRDSARSEAAQDALDELALGEAL
jgi:HEAT repeat protein